MSELFAATPDLPAIEVRCRRLWHEAGIHRFDPAGTGPVFSVDTPPPYTSSAHLHVGHAMSYAQPDFVVRHQRMRGRRIFYPMGFDDNGLPTERYVERKHGIRKDATSRSEFRRLCLEETEAVAATYEEVWSALGLSVDWTHRYSTIDVHCRRTAQRSFLELYAMGRVYRSDDPVFWDCELQTALAQADLDTVERSTWLYDVAFHARSGEPLVISTTRPELLAACVALYHHTDDRRYAALRGRTAAVPLFGHEVPILSDDEVDPDFGTGLMMVCTFGDTDDVRRWKRDSLATRARVDERGRMTEAAGAIAGLPVAEARSRVVALLEGADALVGRLRIDQRVAVSDRSGAVVEFVMRPQWFVRMLDLRDELMARSAELRWHPDWMGRRLEHWIHGLSHDWNISRQRYYGVPFPVWFCAACREATLADERALPVDPLEDEAPVATCPACGCADLEGDPDVMDTWMTSSMTPQILTNWAGTPGRAVRSAVPSLPLTVRAQAHDIIRTWAFYTLLKSHLHEDTIPWTDVVVSGWGLNEQGKRISSRSLEPGQYDPLTVMAKHGADAVRHWAARSKLGQDVRYRERDVKAGRKVALKLWNVARFIDEHRAADAPPWDEQPPEDRWIRLRRDETIDAATAAFDVFDYASAREAADALLWTFTDDWFEIAKDRFWNPQRYDDAARASAPAALSDVLRTLIGLYAPFLPFVTEEIYQQLFRENEGTVSLHVTAWPIASSGSRKAVPEMDAVLAILRAVRVLRTGRRIPQTAELDAVTIDAAAELARSLEAIPATVRAAVRARELRFGPAHTPTDIAGLAVSIA